MIALGIFMKHDLNLNTQELNKFIKDNKLLYQYLPILKLKQDQLKIELTKTNKNIKDLEKKIDILFDELSPYLSCLADPLFPSLDKLVLIDQISIETKNIAGSNIEILNNIKFKNIDHKYFHTPSWVFLIKSHIYKYTEARMHLLSLIKEKEIINKELKKITHKINLFEKIVIPYYQSSITKIKNALNDEEMLAIAKIKIAKKLINNKHI